MEAPKANVLSTGRNAGVATQVISSLIVSMGALLGGLMQGWTSPMSLHLQTDDSPVGPMSKDEIANLVAIPTSIGLTLGFSIIYVANRWGRKPAMVAFGVPTMIGYVMIMFAKTKLLMYAGKSLSSFGGMGITLSQMYVSETAHETIRGIFMAACTMQINFGILVSYIVGKYLNFLWFNAFNAIAPAVYMALMLFLPETPYFLYAKSRNEEAKKSLLWFRGGDVHLAEEEFAIIKSKDSDETEKLTLFEELKTRATKIALTISLIAFLFQTFSGVYPIVNFAGIIFEETGSPLEANDSAILTAILNLIASFLNLFLIDRFGRKPLLYISFIGGAVSLSILTIFLYCLEHGGIDVSSVNWIPIGSLGTFIFCYGLGLASVPGVLMNEMSPTNIKAVVGSVIVFLALALMLVVVQTFPIMDEHFGLWFCFAIPAVINTLGIFFTLFFVRETKGKSLTQIANELDNY